MMVHKKFWETDKVQGTGLNYKDQLLYGLVTAFLLTLYLPHIPVVTNLLLGGLALFSFFYNTVGEKVQMLRGRKEVLVIIIFYLLHVLSLLLSENKDAALRVLVLRLPLLALPVVLGWMYIKPILMQKILRAFVVITILVSLFCILWGLWQYQQTANAALLYNDSLTLIIDKQSIYIAMMVNLALFSIVHLIQRRALLLTSWWCAGVLVLLVANFLLASRIAITILYGSICFFTLYYLISRKRYMAIAVFVTAVATAGVLLFSAFPKTLNRFKELGYTQFDYTSHGAESHYNMQVTPDQWNGANIRLAVWTCGWELVKQHPLLGVQAGDKMDKLMKIYAAKHFDFAYKSRRNLHNNYLDVLVSFGIAGLLLFVTGFFILPFYKLKDAFSRMVLIAFALSLIPETYMDRNMGNMMLGFWVGFLISCYPARTARSPYPYPQNTPTLRSS